MAYEIPENWLQLLGAAEQNCLDHARDERVTARMARFIGNALLFDSCLIVGIAIEDNNYIAGGLFATGFAAAGIFMRRLANEEEDTALHSELHANDYNVILTKYRTQHEEI